MPTEEQGPQNVDPERDYYKNLALCTVERSRGGKDWGAIRKFYVGNTDGEIVDTTCDDNERSKRIAYNSGVPLVEVLQSYEKSYKNSQDIIEYKKEKTPEGDTVDRLHESLNGIDKIYKQTLQPDGKAGSIAFYAEPKKGKYNSYLIEFKADGTTLAKVMVKEGENVLSSNPMDPNLAVALMRNHIESIFDGGPNGKNNSDMRKLLATLGNEGLILPAPIKQTLLQAGADAANPTADIKHGLAVNFKAGRLSIGKSSAP